MDFNNYEPPENPEKTIGIIIIIIIIPNIFFLSHTPAGAESDLNATTNGALPGGSHQRV